MNILKKLAAGGLFAMLAAGSSTMSAHAGVPLTLLLPEVSVLTARVGEGIAEQLRAQLVQAVAAPRVARSARTASVVITESNAVVVEATRLPPVDALADADEVSHTMHVRL